MTLAIVVALTERDDERAVQIGRATCGTKREVVPGDGGQYPRKAADRHWRLAMVDFEMMSSVTPLLRAPLVEILFALATKDSIRRTAAL
jgi:hypothetical protein